MTLIAQRDFSKYLMYGRIELIRKNAWPNKVFSQLSLLHFHNEKILFSLKGDLIFGLVHPLRKSTCDLLDSDRNCNIRGKVDKGNQKNVYQDIFRCVCVLKRRPKIARNSYDYIIVRA